MVDGQLETVVCFESSMIESEVLYLLVKMTQNNGIKKAASNQVNAKEYCRQSETKFARLNSIIWKGTRSLSFIYVLNPKAEAPKIIWDKDAAATIGSQQIKKQLEKSTPVLFTQYQAANQQKLKRQLQIIQTEEKHLLEEQEKCQALKKTKQELQKKLAKLKTMQSNANESNDK
eukprot:395000_1